MLTYGMLSVLTAGIKQLVFPDNCLMCRSFLNSNHERQLCPACLSGLTPNSPPFCGGCSRHLGHFSADGLCSSCRGQERSFNRAWAAAVYTPPLRRLLHDFKYHGKTSLRRTFLPLLIAFIDNHHVPVGQFDCVVPIPLHQARLRERGFNQAEILSRDLAAHYHVRHSATLLERTHHTPSQTVLLQKQRWTNLRGAFKINASENAAERSILLVDDLLTTGATADAAAAALKDAGAAYVGVLTLAITE